VPLLCPWAVRRWLPFPVRTNCKNQRSDGGCANMESGPAISDRHRVAADAVPRWTCWNATASTKPVGDRHNPHRWALFVGLPPLPSPASSGGRLASCRFGPLRHHLQRLLGAAVQRPAASACSRGPSHRSACGGDRSTPMSGRTGRRWSSPLWACMEGARGAREKNVTFCEAFGCGHVFGL
jgi:hypothetical protein